MNDLLKKISNNKKIIFTTTNIIIFITFIIFILQQLFPNAILLLGLNPYFIEYGLYHQIVSTIFVHGGIFHLLMNMTVLFQIGNEIEKQIGSLKFTLLYLFGGISTSIASFLYMYFTSSWANLVGASGAICVLLGFLSLKVKSQRIGLIVWVLAISFLPLFLGVSIGWYAHIAGFIVGWILGYFI